MAVARVAANEGALQNLRDTALVWQVVEGHGRTSAERLEFLRRHSPHVLGRKPCNGGNCEWARQLDHAGTLPPALAATGVRADYWRVGLLPRWRAVLAKAEGLVAGTDRERPYPVAPETWGSVELDSAKAAKHGLYPMGDAGTLNQGFAPRAVSAQAVASTYRVRRGRE